MALAQLAATAQKPAAAKPHAAPHAAAAAKSPACAKLPELSSKIPALPASAPCAKPLYTLTLEPQIKPEYVSPLEGTALKDTLGLESTPTSFSLTYIDTKVGTGELAAPHKWYSIKYTGYLTDGTKFDSSDDHPGKEAFVFQYGAHSVVAGWDTGFAGMHVGGKRRLFIPFQLAYGPAAHGNIPPKSMLVFDLELVAQSDTDPSPKAPPAPPAAMAPRPGTPQAGGSMTGSMSGTATPAARPATPAARPATPPAAAPAPATAPAAASPKPQ